MLDEGMIDEKDVRLINLTDDLDFVVQEIEKSLISQIHTMEKEGLTDTKYYKALTSHIDESSTYAGQGNS
jgi:predicted Rossmann-fold nucleotide-binding protein